MSNDWMRAAAFAWCLALAFAAISACARPKPAPIIPPPDVTGRLESADAAMRAGCFDCLGDALREYDAVRSLPNLRRTDADAAEKGAIRAALLLDLRQRELGTTDDGYLWRARELIGAREDLRAQFAPYAETVDSIPWRVGRYDIPTDSESLRRMQALRANFAALLAERRAHADEDILSAYVWMAFFCAHGSNRDDRSPEALVAPLTQNRETPIVGYRSAICGMGASAGRLERVLEREPRFSEIDFWLGELALGRGRLDEAESRLSRAYAWRQRWPALTVALGHVYFAFEEPARALQFYDETLALSEAYPDALIGRVKALSVTGQHTEAFAAIDAILNGPTRVFPGEAYYWRAWNDVQVAQIDEAENDITRAGKVWVNSEVSKLGGIIAYRRRLLTTARERFEAARKLAPDDCENVFYLGNVQSELREWAVSADSFGAAVACIERAQEALRNQIARIEASTWSEERKTQHIARREQQLASATRMIATSWFNMAAAHYNLGHKEDARQFAQRVADDEQFAERAKEILSLLR